MRRRVGWRGRRHEEERAVCNISLSDLIIFVGCMHVMHVMAFVRLSKTPGAPRQRYRGGASATAVINFYTVSQSILRMPPKPQSKAGSGQIRGGVGGRSAAAVTNTTGKQVMHCTPE